MSDTPTNNSEDWLDNWISRIIDAAKAVEKDGASYLHMPKYMAVRQEMLDHLFHYQKPEDVERANAQSNVGLLRKLFKKRHMVVYGPGMSVFEVPANAIKKEILKAEAQLSSLNTKGKL